MAGERARRIALVVVAALLLGGGGGLVAAQLTRDRGGNATATREPASSAPASTSSSRPGTTSSSTSSSTSTRATSATAPDDLAYAFPIRPGDTANYGRSHHDYPATDIFAPCGTAFVAVVDGSVHELSRVDAWEPSNDTGDTRGGLYVSVVGDDGVRYYGSHLRTVAEALEPGARVRAGDDLGTVGNSGNARGIDCHVHFGLSPPCDTGEWSVRRGVVYPWPYLDSWRSGGRESPALEVEAWARGHPNACAEATGADD